MPYDGESVARVRCPRPTCVQAVAEPIKVRILEHGLAMGALGENLRIDGSRLRDSVIEMAKSWLGVASGNSRQTLTGVDGERRRLTKSSVRGIECSVRCV